MLFKFTLLLYTLHSSALRRVICCVKSFGNSIPLPSGFLLHLARLKLLLKTDRSSIGFKVAMSCLIGCNAGFATVEDQLITSQEIEMHQGIPLEGWYDDISLAKKRAEEKNCPLLIAFLGPNWCPWSDQLESEVLSNKNFLKDLKKVVVLVKVDIPEDFEDQTSESFPGLKLKQQYGISECPALVLVDPSGMAIAKLDYLPLETKEFAGYIRKTLEDFIQVSALTKKETLKTLGVDELKTLYAKAGALADSKFKEELLHQGLKADRNSYFLLEEYGKLLAKNKIKSRKLKKIKNKIIARDPKNEQGCQRRLAQMDFEALSHESKPLKVELAIQPLVQYLQKFGKEDQANAWQMEMQISQYLFSHDQVVEALKHAKTSLEMAPESARSEIAKSIHYLQTKLP